MVHLSQAPYSHRVPSVRIPAVTLSQEISVIVQTGIIESSIYDEVLKNDGGAHLLPHGSGEKVCGGEKRGVVK